MRASPSLPEPDRTVNWRAAWLILYRLELKQLKWWHAIDELVACGLDRTSAVKRVYEVRRTGFYTMAR